MRDRLYRFQVVTIRPIVNQEPDVFGDAPVVVSDNRGAGFRIKMQITDTAGIRGEDSQIGPGREYVVKKTGVIRKRDIPPDAPTGWKPTTNDLVELVDGDHLFITDIQNAFPKRVSVRNPSGGWDGWRLMLTTRQPSMQAATQYDS